MTYSGVVIPEGTLYTLRGLNLNLLPNNLILTYAENHFQDNRPVYYWVLDSRGDDFITFRVQVSDYIDANLSWKYILSPSVPPRELCDYVLL